MSLLLNRPKRKTFVIDGGAGRVISSIPALKKFARLHPEDDFIIAVGGWEFLFWGITELQDRVFSIEQKNIFNDYIKDTIVVSPEPYRLWTYYNQKKSLAQCFDEIINETDDHEDLEVPLLALSKTEESRGFWTIKDAKEKLGKQKTIVLQPFGQGARVENSVILDDDSRSLEHPVFLSLAKKLSEKYNVILFAPPDFNDSRDTFTYKINTDLRHWAGIINACDYFVGCDSSGQHIARGFKKPGTVILGSTFAINTSYPDWFNIFEKKNVKKHYAAIRLSNFDYHLASRKNDRLMDFSEEEIEELYENIIKDLENKT